MAKTKEIPGNGLKGLRRHWKNDALAAISVALIALPLSLGIALAAGAPAMSGIISAVVGGIVTTLYRGGHVSINGPAKGVIAVILLGITIMDDGSGQAFNYVLGAVVVSGGIQAILGLLKLGRLADMFHSTVIHGILAAIGIIIFAKQIHVALGTHSDSSSIVQNLIDAVLFIPKANPFVLVISLTGLVLLLFHSKINFKFIHFFPAPIWVIAMSIPFVYLFNFFDQNTLDFLGKSYDVGPALLLDIPNNVMDSIMHPNFAKIDTIEFWTTVISILIITSIESLAIAKAVDKIDPHKRKTDLNKDLTGIGLSTMAAGFVGGMPVIAVIIRSTVNIHNGAKTKWSNLYQAIFLLLLIVVLSPIMKQVPLCAFAVLLVYTGFKLASPTVFKQVYRQGSEQLIFFVFTMILTLYTNLLTGLLGGLLLALISHMMLARVPIPQFFKMIYNLGSKLNQKPDGSYDLKIKGIANFLGILKIDKLVSNIPSGALVRIDLSETRLVDLTFQEKLMEFRTEYRRTGGRVQITGLTRHIAISSHKNALKSLIIPPPKKTTQREQNIKTLAANNRWSYTKEEQVESSELYDFNFFNSRPLDLKQNIIGHKYSDTKIDWEIFDVIFEEGEMMSREVYDSAISATMQLIHLPFNIPAFVLEGEGFFDKFFDRVLSVHEKDINFDNYPSFSNRYHLTGENPELIKSFFSKSLIEFLEKEDIYHIESSESSIILFKSIKTAKSDEVEKMVEFGEQLVKIISENKK